MSLHLYHLTCKPSSAIRDACYGSFSAPGRQELILCHSHSLELVQLPDTSSPTPRLVSIKTSNAFGLLRRIAAHRIYEENRDYVVVTSDSGRVAFLRVENNTFVLAKCANNLPTYGYVGIRRTIPGEYLATDPIGRAIMVAAVEKDHLVYVTSRDTNNVLTVSSPVEANRSRALTFDLVGLDMGNENPTFAALETTYNEDISATELPARELVFYEYDLGINTCVRKWSQPVSNSAHALIPTPNGGVLVCSKHQITFHKPNHPEIKGVDLPARRVDGPTSEGIFIVAHAELHGKNGIFFSFVQTERGDLFKISLEMDKDKVTDILLQYFDTVAVASRLLITRKGLLFVAAESGDHELYRFLYLGELETDDSFRTRASASSSSSLSSGTKRTAAAATSTPVTFDPRPHLVNLQLLTTKSSLSPCASSFVVKDTNINKEARVVMSCGKDARATIRILRQGLAVTELAHSRLHMPPAGVGQMHQFRGLWCVRHATTNSNKRFDRYIVVSHGDITTVMGKNDADGMIEETTTSGLQTDVATLNVTGHGEHMVQITPFGWRRISQVGSGGNTAEWQVGQQGSMKRVLCASIRGHQMVLAVSGNQILYFESDTSLQTSFAQIKAIDVGADVSCIDVAGKFLVVGFFDKSLRVYSAARETLLQPLSSQILGERPVSCRLVISSPSFEEDITPPPGASFTGGGGQGYVRLDVGLGNGLLVRSILDEGSGAITDTQIHLLGNDPVTLSVARMRLFPGGPIDYVTVCCSTKTWIAQSSHAGGLSPLSYNKTDLVHSFASEEIPTGGAGFVCVSAGGVGPQSKPTLRFVCLDASTDTREVFNEQIVTMDHTARRFLPHPLKRGVYVVLQGDHNVDSSLMVKPQDAAAAPTNKRVATTTTAANKNVNEDDMDVDEDDGMADGTGAGSGGFRLLGHTRVPGSWCSNLVLINNDGKILQRVELDKNEVGVSVEFVNFQNGGGDCLVCGTVVGMKLHPRSFVACRLRTYRVNVNTGHLELLHITTVDDVPMSLCAFDGRFVCGVGSVLTLFDLGMKQLLRKCELRKGFAGLLPFIKRATDNRLVVGNGHESVVYVFFNKTDNAFHVFADDPLSRICSSACDVVDPNTCVSGDKFGNVFLLRLPPGATGDDARSSTASSKSLLWDQGLSGGAPHKLSCEAHFFVGELVTAIHRTTMGHGKADCVLYSTVLGSMGTLVPFDSVDDLDFFALLELQMRRFYKSLVGRDHLSWRSYYAPCKNVVDGDLCEEFLTLEESIKHNVAKEMDRSVGEIEKRIIEARGWVFW